MADFGRFLASIACGSRRIRLECLKSKRCGGWMTMLTCPRLPALSRR